MMTSLNILDTLSLLKTMVLASKLQITFNPPFRGSKERDLAQNQDMEIVSFLQGNQSGGNVIIAYRGIRKLQIIPTVQIYVAHWLVQIQFAKENRFKQLGNGCSIKG